MAQAGLCGPHIFVPALPRDAEILSASLCIQREISGEKLCLISWLSLALNKRARQAVQKLFWKWWREDSRLRDVDF